MSRMLSIRRTLGPIPTFDVRHAITVNSIADLPFGKGKLFLKDASSWMDQIVGGWQLSMIGRFRTGTPVTVSTGGVYPTNYLNSSLAILKPGAVLPTPDFQFNANGQPSLFPLTSVTSFYGQYPGQTGSRNLCVGQATRTSISLSARRSICPWKGTRFRSARRRSMRSTS